MVNSMGFNEIIIKLLIYWVSIQLLISVILMFLDTRYIKQLKENNKRIDENLS
jgi:hypothetical protein